jgi:hypothetical protein
LGNQEGLYLSDFPDQGDPRAERLTERDVMPSCASCWRPRISLEL